MLQLSKLYKFEINYNYDGEKLFAMSNGYIFYDNINEDFGLYKLLGFLKNIEYIKND